MLLAALALMSNLGQTAPTYEIGGEKIPVQVPTWTAPAPATIEVDGWSYGFREGRLIGKTKSGWGWDGASKSVDASGAISWPMLINLVTSIDERYLDGYHRQRGGTLFTDDYRPLKRETALFCHLVQQYTEGKVTIVPTWRVDEQLRLVEGTPRHWADLGPGYLSPHVNATKEKPSEGLGPFASSIILEAGFGRDVAIGRLDGRPVASIPVYDYFDRARPGQLARAMFNTWVAGLASIRGGPAQQGLLMREPLGGGAIPLLAPDDYARGSMAALLEGAAVDSAPANPPQRWAEVRDNPWAKLPGWTAAQVAKYLGGKGLMQSGSAWMLEPESGTEVEVGRDDGQGGILLKRDAQALLAVRLAFADLFAGKLDRSVLGVGWLGGEPFILFSGEGVKPAATDAEMLGVSPPAIDAPMGPTDLKFSPGEAEALPLAGSFAATTVADPERGSVAEIREVAIRRKGWVRLLGGFDPAKTPFLEFSIKPRGRTWPVNLVVEGDGWIDVYRLFGQTAPVAGALATYSESGAVNLDLRSEPVWQKVVVDLKRAKGAARALYLAVPSFGAEAAMPRGGTPSLLFDDLALRAEASGPLTPLLAPEPQEPPSQTAKSVGARAAFAHETTDVAALLKLLEDPSDLVQWNAADRFLNIKSASAVPALTLTARGLSPFASRAASMALGAQATESAYGALRYNFQHALGDYVKEFSAVALPAIDERKILAELSLALHFRRPEARAAAVRALARQPFKEAPLVMLTFLNDLDPTVRLAVIESLPGKDESVLKRVIGEARNDTSDDVRAAAFRRLKEWGAPEAAEAAKDPSPRVRSG